MKKAWGLKDLHVEREIREKGEHKLGRENLKFQMKNSRFKVLTNEDQASLNSQKEGTKHCLLFDKLP